MNKINGDITDTDTVRGNEPKLGSKGICQACGNEIIYVGPYWDHVGMKLRHPAEYSKIAIDMNKINGIEIKQLTSHSDERGFFREILRVTDEVIFGQWSHAKRNVGTGEYHLHQIQTDWWYVPIGIIEVYLKDMRKDSSTYQVTVIRLMSGDVPEVLKIPPGVAHGFEVVAGPIHLFYITSHIYDPGDEGRIPYVQGYSAEDTRELLELSSKV